MIGCLFHWKQAIRRKIIKLGIPDDEVKFAMRRGVIDLLTIVPKDEVHPIGTTYVAAKIMDYCAEKYKQGTSEFNAKEFDASLKCWNAFWDDYFIP